MTYAEAAARSKTPDFVHTVSKVGARVGRKVISSTARAYRGPASRREIMQATRDTARPGILSRWLILLTGGLAYVGFHASFLTMISFLNGGPLPFETAFRLEQALPILVATNLALVALFGIQHAVMARPAFKRVWCEIIPPSLERSIFVAATVVCLFVAMIFWQTIPGTFLSIESEPLRYVLYAIQGLGWGTVVLSTFLIDHFELFGLRQVWCHFRGTELPVQKFRQPFLYKYSRHPMMVGMFLGLWATPDMTFDRVLWAAGFSIYILLGTRLEERDLVSHLGLDYKRYQQEVPRFVGRIAPRSPSRKSDAATANVLSVPGA
jgi:protein-S-isoprenylcysteine O-methyltransferase Ste14